MSHELSFSGEAQSPIETNDAVLAVLAATKGDFLGAILLMERACRSRPSDRFVRGCLDYLRRVLAEGQDLFRGKLDDDLREDDLLVEPLLRVIPRVLRDIYKDYRGLSLLDIGSEWGTFLVPAMTSSVEEVTLVDPSEISLDRAMAKLAESGILGHPYAEAFQDAITCLRGPWLVAQAIFSLQMIPSDDRPKVLRWLARHADRFLVIEYDVPLAKDLIPAARIAWVLTRYCDAVDGWVSQGFEVQIDRMVSNFFRRFLSGGEVDYEQPLASWEIELASGGFKSIRRHHLVDTWWASAWLLDASPT